MKLKPSSFLALNWMTCLFAVLMTIPIGCGTVTKMAVLKNVEVTKRLDLPVPDHILNGNAWVNHIGEGGNIIPVLHVVATNYYSIGYYHGKFFSQKVVETFEEISGAFTGLIPKEVRKLLTKRQLDNILDSVLDKAWNNMQPFVSNAEHEEMAGLADGLKAAGIKSIDLKRIQRMHTLPDLTETSCSALVACKSATIDGNVWQLRILDYGKGYGLEKRPLITVYHSTKKDERTFASIGWIGFLGLVTGVSERGVCISEMGFGNPPGETLAGEPMPFLLKRALRYSDCAKEAVSIIRSANRNNSYAYLVGDIYGNAFGLATSRENCTTYSINVETEVQTGKHILPMYDDVVYAGHFGVKQGNLVKEMKGNLGLEKLKEMSREIAMKSNLHVAIFNLTTGEFWVANRQGNKRAADCDYIHFPADQWDKVD